MCLCVFVCVVCVVCVCCVCVCCVVLCVCSDMLDSRMQRLRLEQEARSKNFEARVADEALSQFNECQRLLNEVELAASKRKIQELEVAAAQPDPKKLKHHIPGKLDRSLESFFGFNSGGRKPSEHMFFCSAHGCDRGFPTVRARGAHMLVHKNSRQRFTYNFCSPLLSCSEKLSFKPAPATEPVESKETIPTPEVQFVCLFLLTAVQVMIPVSSTDIVPVTTVVLS